MDIVRLAEEMKLTSIKAFKLDALKAMQKGTDGFSTTKSSSSDVMLKHRPDADAQENSVVNPISLEQRDPKQQVSIFRCSG